MVCRKSLWTWNDRPLQEANKLENVRLETEKKKASLKHWLSHPKAEVACVRRWETVSR
jgi:hypothetical protein